jgi:hypothetical protein
MGKWTRWGRGSAHGYGLQFGNIMRFSVVLNDGAWKASLNTIELGLFASVEEAKEKVEHEARSHMRLALEDWEKFTAGTKTGAARRAELRGGDGRSP